MKNFIISLAILAIQVAPHPGPDKVPAKIATDRSCIAISSLDMDSCGNISIRGDRPGNSRYIVDDINYGQLQEMVIKEPVKDFEIIIGGIPVDYGDLDGGIVAVKNSSILMDEIVVTPFNHKPSCGWPKGMPVLPTRFIDSIIISKGNITSGNLPDTPLLKSYMIVCPVHTEYYIVNDHIKPFYNTDDFNNIPLLELKTQQYPCYTRCLSFQNSHSNDLPLTFTNQRVYLPGMSRADDEKISSFDTVLSPNTCISCNSRNQHCVYIIDGTRIDQEFTKKIQEDRKKAADEEAFFYSIPAHGPKSAWSCSGPVSCTDVFTGNISSEYESLGEKQLTLKQKPNTYPNAGTHTEIVYSAY